MSYFDELITAQEKKGIRLNQHIPEFRAYLEYASGYFFARDIRAPVVVEIGVLDGAQRVFYENMLGATYMGLDIDKKSSAGIIGDSNSKETVKELVKWLNGRMIDLLFIDGLHTYKGVKVDYELYSPLVKHLVALHDIHTYKLHEKDPVEVYKFWAELKETNLSDTFITIQTFNPRLPEQFNGRPLGIGLVVKG